MPLDVVSPAEAPPPQTTEHHLVNQLRWALRAARQHVDTRPPTTPSQAPSVFQVGKWVWLKVMPHPSGLAPRFQGPYQVIATRFPAVTLRKDGGVTTVNADRLKPGWGNRPPYATQGHMPLPAHADVAAHAALPIDHSGSSSRASSRPESPASSVATLPRELPVQPTHHPAVVTRSGRASLPPQRYGQ